MRNRALTQEEIDSLNPEWRSFLARLAIRCEFCIDEIQDNKDRYKIQSFINGLYSMTDEESFIKEAEAVDILNLDSENPVPGFREEVASMLKVLREEWPLRIIPYGTPRMEDYVSRS